MLKVINGKNKAWTYRRLLGRKGLIYKQTGEGRSSGYFYTNNDSRSKYRELSRICQNKGLKLVNTLGKYERNDNYRRMYLAHDKGLHHQGKAYLCSYCGKKIKTEKMEVDHIISVNAVSKSWISRLFMHLLGIWNVNDVRNLTSSCHKCNRRKAGKQGLWVVFGFLGKSRPLWMVRKTLRIAVMVFVVWWLYDKQPWQNLETCLSFISQIPLVSPLS